MANRHFYMVFENLALSENDWNDFAELFKQRGSANNPQPAKRNHWRYRLDEQAIIFEALYNEAAVNENAIVGMLTSVTGIIPPRIDYETVGNVSTYAIDDIDTLIQRVFGGSGATWEESRQVCLGYLRTNMAEWEPEEEE